jgi:hypothetical protein
MGTTFGHATVVPMPGSPVPAHCTSAAIRSITLPRRSGNPRPFNLHPATARETHVAVLVSGDEAGLLRTPSGSAALAAERVTYLADGRPLEYVRSIMRGDRYRIVLELSQPNVTE